MIFIYLLLEFQTEVPTLANNIALRFKITACRKNHLWEKLTQQIN